MKEYTWTVGDKDIKAYQESLTSEQVIELLKVFVDFDVKSLDELLDVNAKALLKKLIEQGLIWDVIKVVLIPDKEPLKADEIKKMPFSTMQKIWKDFFLYNPEIKNGVLSILNKIGLFLMEDQRKENRSHRKWSFTSLLTGIFSNGNKR